MCTCVCACPGTMGSGTSGNNKETGTCLFGIRSAVRTASKGRVGGVRTRLGAISASLVLPCTEDDGLDWTLLPPDASNLTLNYELNTLRLKCLAETPVNMFWPIPSWKRRPEVNPLPSDVPFDLASSSCEAIKTATALMFCFWASVNTWRYSVAGLLPSC